MEFLRRWKESQKSKIAIIGRSSKELDDFDWRCCHRKKERNSAFWDRWR